MTTLTANQLAFILKCTVDDARRMIARAYEKENNSFVSTGREEKGKLNYNEDDYRHPVKIEILSKHLGMPYLQKAVDDISLNYLNRPQTRGYIYNLPNDIIQKRLAEYDNRDLIPMYKPDIPKVLKSFFSDEMISKIYEAWRERYSMYKFVVIPDGFPVET